MLAVAGRIIGQHHRASRVVVVVFISFALLLSETCGEILTPQYFNLAEGRKVHASATCGEDIETAELYCKLVGATNAENDVNVNVIHGQHCDYCDPNREEKSHPPEYAVDGMETWWQSPPLSRGMKYNEVNFTIDLGQEFHVAYVYVRMGNSPRPGLWILEKSVDYGKSFTPWQYFAESPADCVNFFGEESLKPITQDDSVICTTDSSRIIPLEGGEIPIFILKNRPSASHYFNSSVLQEWTRATNIRLRLLRTRNLLGHLMSVSRQDPTVTRRYFYSIKDISIGGRCMCNGHADLCDRLPADPALLVCSCRHNTCGAKCETCCPGFEQKAWRQSKSSAPFECEPCNCFNHSNNCEYDPEVDRRGESLDIHGKYSGGGVCLHCQHNTEGINCNRCKATFYKPSTKHWNETDVCQSCQCDTFYSTGNCEEGTGKCECRVEYQPPLCNSCSKGYYGYPNCIPCACFVDGTEGGQCEAENGFCQCKTNFGGEHCKECAKSFYNYPDCESCNCNPLGSVSDLCDKVSGNCTCKNNYGGKQCDKCRDGYFDYPSCSLCTCDLKGTEVSICSKDTGRCICKEGYIGEMCDRCDKNFYGYPDCQPCNCSSTGSSGTTCGQTGKCICLTGFAGRTCEQCSPGYFQYPECYPCDCETRGSNGISCDNDGICQCYHNFDGEKCDRCMDGYYNFPACEECNCNPAGVIAAFAGCGFVPKGELCQCKDRVEGRICDTCKPLYWKLNVHNAAGCEECHCHVPGVLGGIEVCDLESGQCTCKPNVVARGCTECDDGTYNLQEDNLFGCTDCGCDVGGASSPICDKSSGQCHCQPRITGQTCKEPIQMHYFPTLYQHQYEAEDSKTLDDTDVRSASNENEFPGFSWKGYAIFSPFQKEILQDVNIYKPSLYRVVLRYMNKGKKPISGVVRVVPENSADTEQEYGVVFQNTTKPDFLTITSASVPVAFVLNPGKWTFSIQADKDLLLDYFAILPEEFYMASILNQKVVEPCTVHETNLCRLFKYPELRRFDTSLGSGAFIDLGENAISKPSLYYDNYEHLDQLSITTNTRLPMVNKHQPEIDYNITLKKPGKYVMIVNYITPLDDMVTHTLNVSILGDNDLPIDEAEHDKIILYKCPYTSMCRQVVTDKDGVVGVYTADENNLHVKLRGPQANVGIHSVVAIPQTEWSEDYIQPKPICIRKDGTCVDSTYPNAPESKKIRFEKEAIINKDQPQPVIKTNHGVNYVYLNQSTNMIDVRAKVPTPGFYTFIVHYYQPDFPQFELDVLIQNGFMYEAYVPVQHCPKNYGCRAIVKQRDDTNKFSLTENFMITFALPNSNKHVYLDHLLVVPSDLYSERILDEDDFDRTDEFISTCGQNHFFIDTNETGFCRDSVFSITAGYNAGALRCQCDYAGVLSFECQQFGGQCPCKENVIGRECSICRPGYYGFPHCKPCACPSHSVCEPITGQCICPLHVTGELCDQCEPLTFGFDEVNGCAECKCNPLGVLSSLQCDLQNGSCACKPYIVGRKCDTCQAGNFGFPYCDFCECNLDGTLKEICDQQSAECLCKKWVTGPACDICIEGTYNLQVHNDQGCTECFCFGKTNRCYSMHDLHWTIIYNMLSGWEVVDVKETVGNLHSETLNMTIQTPSRQTIGVKLGEDLQDETLYFSAPMEYLGKRLTAYGGFLNYTIFYTIGEFGKATLKPDVMLIGASTYLRYFGYEQPPAAMDFMNSVQIVEDNFLLPSGAPAKREHLMTVLKDLKALYIRANYWSATQTSQITDVIMDDGQKLPGRYHDRLASSVEYCECPPNYVGLSCEECAPGYYRISTGPHGGFCVPCTCNGHATACDLNTGICLDCQHNTVGDHCEQCAIGYHGNAKYGTPMDCLICACPLPLTSNNFASGCEVSNDGEHIHCTCNDGYRGARCQFCGSGYFGRPDNPGDFCKPCSCSGNIDTNDLTSCDTVSGDCLKCLNNTYGEACGLCAPGFFGDAIKEKNCQSCVCDALGMGECNSYTGECVCKMNVIGEKCDRCLIDHYGFSSGGGCKPCNCEAASIGTQCDDVTGECRCAPGVTGRTCNKCKSGYWNITSAGCLSCGCKDEFSIGVGCNAETGQCECLPGVIGDKCDHCPHRWAFVKDYGCVGCDSCIDDLLDLTDHLAMMIDPIQTEFNTVASGFFTTRRLAHINDTINNLRPKVEVLTPDRVNLSPISSELDGMDIEANNLKRQSNYSLENSKNLVKSAGELKEKITKMLDDVQQANDDTNDTIDDINRLSRNLLQNEAPRMDTASKLADEMFAQMRSLDFGERETDAANTLDKVDDVFTKLTEFKSPFDAFNTKTNDIKSDLKSFNEKLDDLSNHTQFSLARSQDAQNLYDRNGKERLERNLVNINSQMQETNKNIADAQTLNRNTSDLLDGARINHEKLQDQVESFSELVKGFESNVNSDEDEMNKLYDDLLPEMEKHALDLQTHADALRKILNETLVNSESAVKAATASNVIKDTIDAAKMIVDESVEVVGATEQKLNALRSDAEKSERNSATLHDAADSELSIINNLRPKVTDATQKTIPVQLQHDRNKETVANIEKFLKNYQTKNLDQLLNDAKKHAQSAEANSTHILQSVEGGFQKIEYNLLDAEQLAPNVYRTNQTILQVRKQLDAVNEKLPEILNSLASMPAKRKQSDIKNSLEEKIHKLNEQIALARDLANRINVGLNFNPRTVLELRNPNNIADLSTSTQISGFFRTGELDGTLLFLGNENGTNLGRSKSDDYMALQIVNGYPTLTMDLGNGAEQIVNEKYVADNEWYQFIIDRTGLNAKLTIREQLVDNRVLETVKEQQLEGPLSIFNLDKNQSKLFVGSYPLDFEPPLIINKNSFDGEVEELVVGDTPVSLWNFIRGYENNRGAYRRTKLQTTPTGYRFNGNGYAVYSARYLQLRANSDIKLKFKTFASEGLLFLYGDEHSFLSLELRNGKLLYKYNLGSGTKVWHTPKTYNDGIWHMVHVAREGAQGRFNVDQEVIPERGANISGHVLQLQDNFFLGGYPQVHKIKDVTNVDFDGCIDLLTIMGRPIDLTVNIKSYGVQPGCPEKFSRLVSFYPASSGFVQKNNVSSANNFKLNLKFKTNEKAGLIFYATDKLQNAGISLSLDDGHLKLISQKTELIARENTFNDNEWHVISVRHTNDLLRLDYDDIGFVVADSPPPPLHILYGDIYLGGLPKQYVISKGNIVNYVPFAGCIADATVNGELINFANATDKHGEELGKCVLDKQIGSDTDIHVVPTLPPIGEIDQIHVTEEPEEQTDVYGKNDLPIRGDGGKDDGEMDEHDLTTEEDFDDIETTTWPTPRPHPSTTTIHPSVCALPLEPIIDQEVVRSGSYSYGSQKGSRLEYNVARGKVRKAFVFSLEFKTVTKNGIIFYVSDTTHKQFAALYLQDGYVHFTFNSAGKAALAKSRLEYSDNVWHKVKFSREFGSGKLELDDDIEFAEASQNITKLDVAQPYFVGGVAEKIYTHDDFPLKLIGQFDGCIRHFQMNDKPMENPTTYGVLTCSENMEPGVFFSAQGGYVRLKERFKVGFEFEVKMEIKPRSLNGLIMAVHGKRDYFVLELHEGALNLTVENGKGAIITTFRPASPHQFCDGNWHRIQAVKSKSIVTLAVNGVYSEPGIGDHKSASTDTIGYLFLGGHRMIQKARGVTARTPYVGCIRDVRVNSNTEIKINEKMIEGGVKIGLCPTN